jgi:predicted nucleotidyltransferase
VREAMVEDSRIGVRRLHQRRQVDADQQLWALAAGLGQLAGRQRAGNIWDAKPATEQHLAHDAPDRAASATTSVGFDALRTQIAALCREYGIAELSVFGSVARGDDRPDSDVDLLYVRAAQSVFGWEFFGFQEELEALLGRSVDVVPKDNLHWVIRDRVLADSRVVYAA